MPSKALLFNALNTAGVTINGSGSFDIRVHNKQFYYYFMLDPSLASGEGYVNGWWDCDHLDELFYRICRYNLSRKFYPFWKITLQSLLNTLFNFQTPSKSNEVAEKHYNLGNEFYRHMLGETMAYTCAYWKTASSLDSAQLDKFDLICRKINLKPNERVLDLGCGWGTLAKYMAEKYGCQVVAVNISVEQVNYAREICKGLPVDVFRCDYRDISTYNADKQPFDKVVSIGLCEHIGHKNYRNFIKLVKGALKPNGLFLLHTIGKNDSRRNCDSWINKYIFPNGILPSINLLSRAMEHQFIIEDVHNFGADYDKTLMAWYHNFKENWNEHLSHKRDERFFRLWSYYLLSCAGGFRARTLELWQMVLSPSGVLGGYESVR